MLTLRLLGELEVERDGLPVRLPQSRKTRALLGYLALAGRPQRRDRLVSMFWDVPDDPRGALRWSLSKLREVVDEPGQKRLLADRETVAFAPDDAEIDCLRLAALAQAGPEGADPAALSAAAEAVLRGELLQGLELPDCAGYQVWLVAEREQAAKLRLSLLTAAASRLRERPEDALRYARAAAELAPQDGAARAALVRLLAAADRPLEAEEQCRAGLRELAEAGGPGAAELESAWAELQNPARQPPPRRPDQASDSESARVLSRPAVAVLPFENLSGDPADDFLGDGIAEDLITALCHWRWFPVIARNSSFVFKGRHVDITAVGSELGARYVVEGSVRRAGDRVRVTAQLIDASTGHHVWAQRYDRQIDDIFALQDELTEQIAVHIEPELSRAERQRAERKPQRNLAAWEINLRALGLIRKGGPADLQEAQRLLQESLRLDPTSSRTHAIKAFGLYQQALLGWTADPIAASASYYRDAHRAVELDEDNWLAHALLGMSVLWHRRDFDTASHEVFRAIDLNPSAALAHQFLGCVLIFDGRPAEASPHLEAALRLNPRGNAATLLLSDLSLSHLLMGKHPEAVAYARRALNEFPGDTRALQRLLAALGHLGAAEEAAETLRLLEKRQGRLTLDYIDATYPFRRPGDRDILLDGLARAGWRADR